MERLGDRQDKLTLQGGTLLVTGGAMTALSSVATRLNYDEYITFIGPAGFVIMGIGSGILSYRINQIEKNNGDKVSSAGLGLMSAGLITLPLAYNFITPNTLTFSRSVLGSAALIGLGLGLTMVGSIVSLSD